MLNASPISRALLLPLLLSALCANAQRAGAQCVGWWVDESSLPGTDGTVYCSAEWDPDGPGPKGPVLVIGGTFSRAGDVAANCIAAFDRSTGEWLDFGGGMRTGGVAAVHALAVLPNGGLAAGGDFASAGGVPVNNVARWDGTGWRAYRAGVIPMNRTAVRSLAVAPNGDLIAGGGFYNPGLLIARWNGAAWSPIGGGFNSTGSVDAITFSPNGDMLVGGSFALDNGLLNIARWNGSTWSRLGDGIGGRVAAIRVLPNGDIVAGGSFIWASGVAAYNLARWDGTHWNAFSPTLTNVVETLDTSPTGELLVGGIFPQRVARWTGTGWESMGTGLIGGTNQVREVLRLDDDALVAAGDLLNADGRYCGHVAIRGGQTWGPLDGAEGSSAPISIQALVPFGNGCIAGGVFTINGEASGNRVARWENGRWTALGQVFNGAVRAVARLTNGDVIAAGEFTQVGTLAANRIARWNGAAWSAMGNGVNGAATSLAVTAREGLIVGGAFTASGSTGMQRIARWTGAAWSELGGGVRGGTSVSTVSSLLVLPDGDLVAGGTFQAAGTVQASSIARWNGVSWSAFGPGLRDGGSQTADVKALAMMPNGDLLAAGRLSLPGVLISGGIARWDGTAWVPLHYGLDGTPFVGSTLCEARAVAVLPNGDILVGGAFTRAGIVYTVSIARWNGEQWGPLTANFGGQSPIVNAMTLSARGDLIVGGEFSSIGSVISPAFTRYVFSGYPTVEQHPSHATLDVGDTVTLTATPTAGILDASYQWLRDGVPVADGPGGASLGGGIVTGSVGVLASPTDGSAVTLTIAGAQASDRGTYSAVLTNGCGARSSNGALVRIGVCRADINNDDGIDSDDAVAFFEAWDRADPLADFDADGQVTGDDVIAFFARWDAGC